ncbi:MAG: Ig-like domain-containing protein, partial [Verrucomicrobia bacterium]|nr:Ig-like domain-containing protein [Verrucomicrobiota bacterium]
YPNNAWLELGRTYTNTATAVSGYRFLNWVTLTNGVAVATNTGASLAFLMQSNLTLVASFLDTNHPTVAISAPTAGQFWSNLTFTARGTAADNTALAGVWWQLNGAGWNAATTTNNWTNWSAALTLQGGTNILQAYAADATGNLSTTGAVSFTRIVTDTLLVRATGQGTLSPNYSNALLRIGSSFTTTATAVNGHKFVNWIVATNWLDGVVKTNASLSFIMQSNLTLQANFVDTNLPTLAITAPTSGQRWSNELFTVRGTARDNMRVTNVAYQLNGGDWLPVTTTNVWTNWTAAVTLLPGTNTVRAFAEDATGNRSSTNTVAMQFVVTNRLLVAATGQGTLSPNYSNAWLEIGRSYTMAATAVNGHKFVNWIVATNWLDGVAKTNASLTFMMQSNLTLQVNFLDTNKPTLTVTAPTSGQRWSNELFTVRGTARDNMRVTNVSYQLNGGDWTAVTTTNVWTNWTAAVTLLPGTNTVRAFAEDATGNRSATNTVAMQFVVTNRLLVAATGQGTLSPNYSNAWLEIGRSYTTAATPVNGHKFVNWIVSTNWLDGAVKTNASLSFIMQSNLTLQVNFLDTNKPTLTVTAPTSGQRWSNELFTVRGTARDNMRVTNVSYQLNGGDWTSPDTTNVWTNWTAGVTLLPGTNTVRAFAEDATGNRSATNTTSLQFVVTNRLTLLTTGRGTISPNYSNAWLEIGRAYSMTATAGSGFVFSNWDGSLTAFTPTLAFLMQSNLVLQANFITNPFVPAKGVYNGLFYETNEVRVGSAGYFTTTTTDSGGYSGSLSLAGQSLPFTGQMRVDGSASNNVPRTGTNALVLALNWNLADRQTVTGTVAEGHWTAELAANRSPFNATTNPAPPAGSFTMILPGSEDFTNQPGGDSYGAVTVSAGGQITFSGKLADNTTLSQTTTLSGAGQWPFFQSLYTGKGLALGWLAVATNEIEGEVIWIKLAQSATYYPGGFDYQTNIIGSRYRAPAAGQRVINVSTGQVWLANGNLAQSFTNVVRLTTNNAVVNLSSNALTFTIATNTGTFSGSATDPATLKVYSFSGVILQNGDTGSGFFPGTNKTGRVFIGP